MTINKTLIGCLILLTMLHGLSAQEGGTVLFNTQILGTNAQARFNGMPLSGTAWWAQMYAANGVSALESQLFPVSTPVNFGTGSNAGYVMTSGNAVVSVTSVPRGPASVQMRVWAAPFATYEHALAAQGATGTSRILRLSQTGGDGLPAVQLADDSGPLRFSSSCLSCPSLWINDVVATEGTAGLVNVQFTVRLTLVAPLPVTVSYATANGSALAGRDYLAAAGTLTFQPGELAKTIAVLLTPDIAPEPDENFFVDLTDPLNAALIDSHGSCAITELSIAEIRVNTNTVVSFNTVVNHIYTLESTDDLNLQHWSPVNGGRDLPGTGGVVTLTDQAPSDGQGRFYRVRLVQ